MDSAADALIERRFAASRCSTAQLLHVRRDRVRLPDGSEATREYVVHPGRGADRARARRRRARAERQFRYPLDRVFLEFPAGKIDPGEAPLATAQRELAEEAGYTAAHWTRLGVIHPVISYSTEAIEIYVAEGLTHVGAKLDAGEFLEIVTLHRSGSATRHSTAARSPTPRPSPRSRCIRAG